MATTSQVDKKQRDSMAMVIQQLRERPSGHGPLRSLRRYSKIQPPPSLATAPAKPVLHLDLRSCVPPENLKTATNCNVLRSRAKRECKCSMGSTITKNATMKAHLLRFLREDRERCNRSMPDFRDCAEHDENFPNEGSHRWNTYTVSIAQQCEAKLEILLNPDPEQNNGDAPDVKKTHICFTILEELCRSKLPFSSFLTHICDELRNALYQTSDDGTTKQVTPYFELVNNLEAEINTMESENTSWRNCLSGQDRELNFTKGQLKELRDELNEADSAGQELERKLSSTMHALTSEQEKVNGLHGKIKKLKQELKAIRKEVKESKRIEDQKPSEIEEYEKMKTRYMQLLHEYQHVQTQVNAAQAEADASAPKADLVAAKAEILELGAKVGEVKAQIGAFACENRALTPRPEWGGQIPGMDKLDGVTSADQIEKICRENGFLSDTIYKMELGFASLKATLTELQEQAKAAAEAKAAKKAEGNKRSKSRDKVKEKKKPAK